MKAQVKLFEPVHESCVLIAYASSEGSDEPAPSQQYHHSLRCSHWKKKRCRWRFIPNFVSSKEVVLLLLIHFNVPPNGLWRLCVWSLFCYALSVHSSFAIILTRKREHDALLYPSFYYMTLDKCIVLRIGTLTGCPLCRESHPLCKLNNPRVI